MGLLSEKQMQLKDYILVHIVCQYDHQKCPQGDTNVCSPLENYFAWQVTEHMLGKLTRQEIEAEKAWFVDIHIPL